MSTVFISKIWKFVTTLVTLKSIVNKKNMRIKQSTFIYSLLSLGLSTHITQPFRSNYRGGEASGDARWRQEEPQSGDSG